MPIYAWCPNCGTEYSIKHTRCPKCGTPRPRVGRFRIFIQLEKKTVKKLISNISLADVKKLETIIKQRIIEGIYTEKPVGIEFNTFVKQYYLPSEKNNKKPESLRREIELYRKYISPFLADKKIKRYNTKRHRKNKG
ncbi:hypothetical protein [Hippea alviniae]|uniref:hypothetical protein n=1 Tax=Hippea alviniae TaxID=1279027 RepID=UPI0003B780BD|nr:hypothetical protein [Hippea alviniae]